MAVTSVTVSHEGWSGSSDIREGRKYSVTYVVQCNDPADGAATILDSPKMPTVGAAYSVGNDDDGLAALKSLTVSPVAGSRNLWTAQGTFEPIKPESGEKGNAEEGFNEETGEPEPNPLLWSAMLSWSTVRVQRPALSGAYLGMRRYTKNQNQNQRAPLGRFPMNVDERLPKVQSFARGDANGMVINGVAITNSVFHPFDPPPEIDYSRISLRYTFNTDRFPLSFMKWTNCINRDEFEINHVVHCKDILGEDKELITKFKVPKYSMKILGVAAQAKTVNDVGHFEVSIDTEIDTLYGYRYDLLDRGYSEAATAYDPEDPGYDNPFGSTPLVDENGNREAEPCLLDGRGRRLDLRNNAAVFLVYGLYPEKAFKAKKFHLPAQMKNV